VTERQVELHGRLAMPEAVLIRTDLAYPRRAVDVIFKHVTREGGGVQIVPGFRSARRLDASPSHAERARAGAPTTPTTATWILGANQEVDPPCGREHAAARGGVLPTPPRGVT